MKEFKKYTIAINNVLEGEWLIAMLSEYGIDAFEEKDKELVASGNSLEIQEPEIDACLEEGGFLFTKELLADQNWNAVWESSFEPVRVEDFVSVRASFHQPVQRVEHEIVITPKMSFGTGHHATTWLVIQLMRDVDFVGKRVFDFGTGTGVLAILAEKLGASSVLAIDNDEWSINNAQENIANNLATNIEAKLMDEPPDIESFAVILANINKHILLQYMPAISKIAAKAGTILMSGLLVADEDDIVENAAQNQLVLKCRRERNGWLALIFSKE